MSSLRGTRVLIAGGGLSGLAAAEALSRLGAEIHLVDARDRLGGRVLTLRDARGVHVEGGGEFIDHAHTAIRELAASLHVPLVRVLRGGFGLALRSGRRTTIHPSPGPIWSALTARLAPYAAALEDGGGAWDGAVATALASRSVGDLVPPGVRPAALRAFVEGLRGFYLAEPEGLSALVLVDQVRSGEPPGRATSYRVRGGNDRLIEALRRRIRGSVTLGCVVRRVAQNGRGVRVTVERGRGTVDTLAADYAILTCPPPLLRACAFEPSLPERQRAALGMLDLGPATKVSLRFDRPWWRRRGRPRAFGSNLPIGAVWEAAEDRRAAVLTLLGGASSSASLASLARDPAALSEALAPLGPAPRASAMWPVVSWERERWSGGGYAVFAPAFDPRDRRLLSAAHGRVLFAGEHGSERWQGFMNGAVESGQRAAREVEALRRLEGLGGGR